MKAAELDPAGATHAYYNLAVVAIYSHLPDEETKYLRKAIKLDPANAEAYHELGMALTRETKIIKDGRQLAPPKAVKAFNTYLKLMPKGYFAQYDKQIINEGLPVSPRNPCAKLSL